MQAESQDTTVVSSLPMKDEQTSPALSKSASRIESGRTWEDDPAHPRNWSSGRKWTNTLIVSLYTFVSPLASSMMAPGLEDIATHYGITNAAILAMTLSIFLLAYALGPLFLAPLSEMYGRKWVLHITNAVFIVFNIACAFAPSTGSLIAFRFLAGVAGSAPIAIGGGVVGDLFNPHDRASAMAIYTLGPLIGPVVGPISGGFIAETIGFKWIFIVIGALGGLAAVIALPLLKETYAPVLQDRLYGVRHQEKGGMEYIWINLKRPVVLLTQSYVCFILSLYMALMYGIQYLMFTTFPVLFGTTYGFSSGISGLAYIGLGVGFCGSAAFGARWANTNYRALSVKHGKEKPEFRLPSLIVGALMVPMGLLWYGWSAQEHNHWIVPILGSTFVAFGMMTVFLCIQLYLVDTFAFAASALSAAAVFRSLLGFVFPLFAQQMYDKLGYGGGNSLLAGLSLALIPFPIWLYYHGERLRARSKLSRG